MPSNVVAAVRIENPPLGPDDKRPEMFIYFECIKSVHEF